MRSSKSAEKTDSKSLKKVSARSSAKTLAAKSAAPKSAVKSAVKHAMKAPPKPSAKAPTKPASRAAQAKTPRIAEAAKHAAKVAPKRLVSAKRARSTAAPETTAAKSPVDDAQDGLRKALIASTVAAVVEKAADQTAAAAESQDNMEAAPQAIAESQPLTSASPIESRVESSSQPEKSPLQPQELESPVTLPQAVAESATEASAGDSLPVAPSQPAPWTTGVSFDEDRSNPAHRSAALVAAAREGNLEVVRSLLQNLSPSQRNSPATANALFAGVGAAEAEVVALLLEAGADANVPSDAPHRCRPLHYAIQCAAQTQQDDQRQRGSAQVIRALLLGGADVQARGAWCNVTPIVLAAMLDQGQFLHDLLPYCESWDIFNASALGKADIAAMILRRDAGAARAQEVNGMSALHYCAASALGKNDAERGENLARTAREIIAFGADVNAPADLGDAAAGDTAQPPIAWATANRPVAEVLLAAGADATAGLRAAIRAAQYDAAEFFMQRGAQIRAAAVGQMLCDLARHGRGQPCKWLIERGADVNARGAGGRTTLHHACARGASESFVEYLLSRGADANVCDDMGRLPIDLAVPRKKARLSMRLNSSIQSSAPGPAKKAA